MKYWVALILLLFSAPVENGCLAGTQPQMIRIALHRGVESLKLDGKGLLFTDGNGDMLRFSPPLVVKRGKDGIAVNGRTFKKLIASAPATLTVNGKGYRGVVEVTGLDHGLLAVNELPLEEYLVGLINCEISSQWPMEAIKAQAVIARSYALYQKESRKNATYHLESSVMDQVYDGCDIEDSRAARGVRETAGEVLTYRGGIVQAFYHSNCGGHTEAAENVWGVPLAYLQGVECRYCQSAPNGRWEQVIPLTKVEAQLKAAGFNVSGLKEVRPAQRNGSGRQTELTFISSRGRQVVSAVNFRKALGYGTIRSTNFDVRIEGGDLVLSGVGFGHGVGLCQWGSKQRAGDGFDYREILAYYYPGVLLENLGQGR